MATSNWTFRAPLVAWCATIDRKRLTSACRRVKVLLEPVLCPGEDVFIRLSGSCEEVDVHLEPDLVNLTRTYISLSTVNRTVSLINKHSIPLQYCWTTASSIQEEALDFIRSVCRDKMDSRCLRPAADKLTTGQKPQQT